MQTEDPLLQSYSLGALNPLGRNLGFRGGGEGGLLGGGLLRDGGGVRARLGALGSGESGRSLSVNGIGSGNGSGSGNGEHPLVAAAGLARGVGGLGGIVRNW